jgi:hypothetical protein
LRYFVSGQSLTTELPQAAVVGDARNVRRKAEESFAGLALGNVVTGGTPKNTVARASRT